MGQTLSSKTHQKSTLWGTVLSVPFLFAAAGTSLAQETKPEFSISGHVGFLTDYRFRGLSLSDEEPVLQGSLVANYGGFYAGAWSSPIELPSGNVEVDLFTGYNFSLQQNTTLTLQAAYITFPGESDSNFFRATAGLSGTLFNDRLTYSTRVDYEPQQDNSFRAAGDNIYWSNSLGTQLAEVAGTPINLSLGLGFEDGSAPLADQKWDWTVGVSADAFGLTWALQYIDTDVSGTEDPAGIADGTALFSITMNF